MLSIRMRVAIFDAVMEHFIYGRQIHGHRNHGPQKMGLSRFVDNFVLELVIISQFYLSPGIHVLLNY